MSAAWKIINILISSRLLITQTPCIGMLSLSGLSLVQNYAAKPLTGTMLMAPHLPLVTGFKYASRSVFKVDLFHVLPLHC